MRLFLRTIAHEKTRWVTHPEHPDLEKPDTHDTLVITKPSGQFTEVHILSIEEGIAMKVALALLNSYPQRLIERGDSLLTEVRVPDGTDEILRSLPNLKEPIPRDEIRAVLKLPTAENVRRLINIANLISA